MNLTAISENIESILNSLETARTLPNNPNIGGILEETTIVFVITEGNYQEKDVIDLTLKVSLACQFREESTDIDKPVLNNLISYIINRLHRSSIPNCRPINFSKFENFTPESGKWRALIEFNIPAMLISFPLENVDPLDEIKLNYDHVC